jgi:hypothetical protein
VEEQERCGQSRRVCLSVPCFVHQLRSFGASVGEDRERKESLYRRNNNNKQAIASKRRRDRGHWKTSGPPSSIPIPHPPFIMVNTHENAGIALLLVFGAGSATALGAMVVFFPFLVKYAKTRTLAAALGLSAGVMMYVSFVEIFQKSHLSFIAAGHDTDRAYIYATGCFFGGVVLMVVRSRY